MKIQLIDFGGRSPERAYANDAGADVFSTKDEVIRPGDICKLPLGFGLKIPDGYAGYIFPRVHRELYASCHLLIPDIRERFMQSSPMSATGNMKSRRVIR